MSIIPLREVAAVAPIAISTPVAFEPDAGKQSFGKHTL
jgi:hypothetical protein